MKLFFKSSNLFFEYIDNIYFRLHDVNLCINEGESIALLGANGCGKTTLTYIIARIIPNLIKGKLQGELLYFDDETTVLSLTKKLPASLSFLFQNPEDLFLSFSVKDEFFLVSPTDLGNESEMVDKITQYLGSYDLKKFISRSSKELSMGEMQKISILIAAYQNPKVFILDEPTTAIDVGGLSIITEILHRSKGTTKIISTHNFNWAKKTCDRIIGIKDGSIAFDLKAKDCFESHYLSLFNNFDYNSKLKQFNKLLEHLFLSSHPSTNIDVKVTSLNYFYGFAREKLLCNLSFQLTSNQIHCIMGPNGSGKTTLLLLLAGIIKPKSGYIHYNNISIDKICSKNFSLKVVIMLQNPSYLLISDSIKQELTLSLKQLSKSKHFIDSSLNLIAEVMNLPSLEISPQSLSFGWQKILSLISCICLNPDVLILDEPELGLDYNHKRIISQLIKALRDNNKLVILTSHEEEFARDLAQVGFLLNNGEILKYDSISNLVSDYNDLFKHNRED